VRSQVEKQLVKKRQNVSSYEISEFFFVELPYKKDEMQEKQLKKYLALLIAKSNFLIHHLESPWLKQFAL
jgi:hypothetical protein